MKYARIIMACAGELWAMERQKLATVVEVLAFQAAGGKLDAGELAARGISDRRASEVVKTAGNVAVLPIYGVLAQRMNMLDAVSSGGGTSIEQAQAVFRGLLADDQVKAIILNFDSPGGAVAGTDEFAAEIFDARGIKPIVAQIDSTAASAAYWLAAQADEIVATPGALAGAIGVYTVHEEISAALDKAGIKRTVIASSDAKAAGGTNFEPLSDEARADIQDKVNYAADRFVRSVARGRGVSQVHARENFGDGKVFNAEQLMQRGMADRIAPLKDTLERFGVQVSPKKRNALGDVRRANAAGETVSIRSLENALGELGFSNSAATVLAGGLRRLDQGDPGDQAANSPTRETLGKLTDLARGFSLSTQGAP